MRIPIKWLKDYIETNSSAKKIAEELTMSGTETEILSSFEIHPNVVVGEILEINTHPNADKLRIPRVRISSKGPAASSQLDIVCGAKNIEVGQKVAVALEGTVLGEFEIKEVEIRGVKSKGMICSEQELGIADHSEGIMVLESDAPVGTSLNDVLKTDKDILEAELTPNRSDCFSMIGIARELSVVEKKTLKIPSIRIRESRERTSSYISIKNSDYKLCPNYTARIIKIEKNLQSPDWIRERLADYGVRPINAVVDITNFVMIETGQPLHAFDMQKLKMKNEKLKIREIEVRSAKKGEEMITLDKVKRKLTENDLVITDGESPIAIAGVMGGKETEVNENTKVILLESASFDRTAVRKTAQRLSLRSESSNRFEKGIPKQLNSFASDRAAQLILEICDGEILKGRLEEGEGILNPAKIKISLERFYSFLGERIEKIEVMEVLKRLGFDVKALGKDELEIKAPWWRLDITIPEDIYEEIIRIYGYNNVKSTLPKGEIPPYTSSPLLEKITNIKTKMKGFGFTEVYNYSFISEDWLNFIGEDKKDAVRIDNPLNKEMEYMRTSLVPSILSNLSKNQNNFPEIKIFEIAKTYNKGKSELPKEEYQLSLAILGGETRGIKYKEAKEFYQAKGILDSLLSGYEWNLKREKYNFLNSGKSVSLYVEGKIIGFIGEIENQVQNKFDIKKTVSVFNINLTNLEKNKTKDFSYLPFSRFPAVVRDLNFVLDKNIEIESLLVTASLKNEILKSINVKDIYEGKELEGKKSVTITLLFQSDERTLKESEVSELEIRVINEVKKKLGGSLR